MNSFLAEHFGHSLSLSLSFPSFLSLRLSSINKRGGRRYCRILPFVITRQNKKMEKADGGIKGGKKRGAKKKTGEKWLRRIKAGLPGKLQFDTVMLEIQGGNIERSGSFVEDRRYTPRREKMERRERGFPEIRATLVVACMPAVAWSRAVIEIPKNSFGSWRDPVVREERERVRACMPTIHRACFNRRRVAFCPSIRERLYVQFREN